MKSKNLAPVLMVFGQSNAHGHGAFLAEEERIVAPLTRVLTLHCDENQTMEDAHVVWRGYTTAGSNLAETQDHTACLPTAYAKLWEKAALADPELPDLYVIRISIGAQGITKPWMWYPFRSTDRFIPGPLGTADMPLYAYSCRVIERATDSLRALGKSPVVLGLHWLGTEEETGVGPADMPELFDLHMCIIGGWRAAARCSVPVKLYYLRCDQAMKIQGQEKSQAYVNETFSKLAEILPDVECVDSRSSPLYHPEEDGLGMYSTSDYVHYTVEAQNWLGENAFEKDIARVRRLWTDTFRDSAVFVLC